MFKQVENLIYKNLTICPYCFWIKSFYLWLFNLWLFNFWVIASFQFLRNIFNALISNLPHCELVMGRNR
jgi:hypothetical protein